eukprot:1957441-Pyramimonas_sp.AAC.1
MLQFALTTSDFGGETWRWRWTVLLVLQIVPPSAGGSSGEQPVWRKGDRESGTQPALADRREGEERRGATAPSRRAAH